MMKKIDITEDQLIFRSLNGIVLVNPEESANRHIAMYQNINHTIKSILNLPCNIYFYDLNNRYQLVNELCAESCGFDSAKAALNKTLFDTGKSASARIIHENNTEVLKKNKMKIIEEEFILKNDDFSGQGISIKLPWYNNNHEIIGIFGMTVVFGKQKLDDILSHTLDIGLLSQDKYFHKLQSNKFDFTRREMEIIHYLMLKNTAKEIGTQLGLSHRTVEKNIELIKKKLKVKTKSDIRAKIMDDKIF